jgi:hypothetical protein
MQKVQFGRQPEEKDMPTIDDFTKLDIDDDGLLSRVEAEKYY